jgi:hypothetical protein
MGCAGVLRLAQVIWGARCVQVKLGGFCGGGRDNRRGGFLGDSVSQRRRPCTAVFIPEKMEPAFIGPVSFG